MTILAHASDDDGVGQFEFYIDGTRLAAFASAGARQGEASTEWEPQQPGVYTVAVRAHDAAGNVGAQALARVTIGAPSEATPPQTPATSTDAPADTATPTPSSAELTVRSNAHCRAGPGQAYDSLAALAAGQVAAIVGRNQDSSWWQVTLPDGGLRCWISATLVEARGDLAAVPVVSAPPVSTPTRTPTSIPPTAAMLDFQPPAITGLQAAPPVILIEGPGCPTYSRTVVVSAQMTDASGIASAEAAWSLGSLIGSAAMSGSGDVYTAVLGPFGQVGTLEVVVHAQDMVGNLATAGPVSVSVMYCIE